MGGSKSAPGRGIVGLLAIVIIVNATIPPYWLSHAGDLPRLAGSDPVADLFRDFAAFDHGFFDRIGQAERGLMAMQVAVVLPLDLILFVALLRRWPVRIPLQIAVGAVTVYAVLFKWLSASMADFAAMDAHTVTSFVFFFGVFTPFLSVHAYMLFDGWRSSPCAAKTRSDRLGRDRAVVALCLFFVVVACTIERLWLQHAIDLPEHPGWLTACFRFYARGDRGYYDQVSAFERSLETFEVYVTQVLFFAIAIGVLRRARWRFPLQLCVGAYLTYSVTLYFVAKHMTDYAQMPRHDLVSFLILVVPNLPWLLGNLFLALDAGAVLRHRAARAEDWSDYRASSDLGLVSQPWSPTQKP